ncbi:hypothetical protein L1887_34830 [Cichorium endivia]|nr:hypothetical protein L1887_34830 [Cichorium endivia]
MKFMRLGKRPDTFHTTEATRTMISDLPSDLTIRINNITYLLHKFPLLQKCGHLQQLFSGKGDTRIVTMELHDIPGGENAFELCAKFCYGIKIDLSAHNFVPALCAAKFLEMTESVAKGNFVSKLEVFFSSCILEGWKDCIVTLQTTETFHEQSLNLEIIRKCIDSIVDKILTPPPRVKWSYTYTRPEYAEKKHKSAPKDWWTEDIADLNIDLFRCVINTVKSTDMLPPKLIGEALHVYACHWLPDVTKSRAHSETSTSSQTSPEESLDRKKILETIVTLIPEERGSVSFRFLLRLLSMVNLLGASIDIRKKLIRKCSLQLEEATTDDLILPSHDTSGDHHSYDIEPVRAILEGFITQWRKSYSIDEEHSKKLIIKVSKLIDSYLQVVSKDPNMSVDKVVSLANALPEFARTEHDDLYKAIDIYLKAHTEMRKEEKKRICSILDCHKLSAEACAHAVKNERLPLRTVVQVLFFEREKLGGKVTRSQESQKPHVTDLQLRSGGQSTKEEGGRRRSAPGSTSQKLERESEEKSRGKTVQEMGPENLGEIIEEGGKGNITKVKIQRSKSEHGRRKGK